ncbi:hypothetical protein QFZ65_002550 [Arthrobacter sp. B3I9]|uniref:hypothetical protein n=1 Tax=Arthrobacter sp. B3I9 TaxID=3042270 RepID=UPI00278E0DF4|nr:hypothetical protein [Arthrobacter sp. B3I9]MDQ0850612.1 hypothetical protein [Arthrobacter sp. B3I9]
MEWRNKVLSEADAQKLKEALKIKAVKNLGTNKFFLWATPSPSSPSNPQRLGSLP